MEYQGSLHWPTLDFVIWISKYVMLCAVAGVRGHKICQVGFERFSWVMGGNCLWCCLCCVLRAELGINCLKKKWTEVLLCEQLGCSFQKRVWDKSNQQYERPGMIQCSVSLLDVFYVQCRCPFREVYKQF